MLDRQYPRIFTQARVQLRQAHVHADHPAGTQLQQTIGESAGRLPDVQANLARNGNAGLAQSAQQLQATARDVLRL